MKNLLATAVVLACCAHRSGCLAEEPKRDLLGVDVAMTQQDAEKQLKKIGAFERNERKQQQIWKVRDDRFSHLIIGADKEGKLRFVTAVARVDKGAKRVRYQTVGDLKAARQTGDPSIKNFSYEWSLPNQKGQPETLMIARGRDPEFLSTLSLKRIGDARPATDEKD